MLSQERYGVPGYALTVLSYVLGLTLGKVFTYPVLGFMFMNQNEMIIILDSPSGYLLPSIFSPSVFPLMFGVLDWIVFHLPV